MKRLFSPYRGMGRLVLLCILFSLFLPFLALGHSSARPMRIIFLHHSCGHDLIEHGGVREGLTALGYEFYDHGYNDDGLRLADGSYTGTDFDVPGDNTDPDGIAEIFAQPLHDPPDNTFSHLMGYDVIAFKSCYPTSNIWGDEHLAELKSYYLAVRDRMDQYPDKIFIVVTQPPQVPGASDLEEAVRARALADWLKSDEFLAAHPNVFTFDFFGYLAGEDNFLRADYRFDDYDGHPNERANQEIGPLFVEFIDGAIRGYEAGGPRPTVAPPTPLPPSGEATEPPPPVEPTPPPVAPPLTTGQIDDFESAADYWEAGAYEEGSSVECGPDTTTAHGGTASLRIHYDIVPEGWVDCGRYFDPPQDWSGGAGLSLWLNSEGGGQWITLMLFAGDPDNPTPFEVYLESVEGWTQFVFSWADFGRAEWADEGGLSELDPARITGYAFSLGADDVQEKGTLWVDDVGLAADVESPAPVVGAATTTTPAAPDEEPSAPAAPTEKPGEEEESGGGGGLCGSAALPLGCLGIWLVGRRRRWGIGGGDSRM